MIFKLYHLHSTSFPQTAIQKQLRNLNVTTSYVKILKIFPLSLDGIRRKIHYKPQKTIHLHKRFWNKRALLQSRNFGKVVSFIFGNLLTSEVSTMEYNLLMMRENFKKSWANTKLPWIFLHIFLVQKTFFEFFIMYVNCNKEIADSELLLLS